MKLRRLRRFSEWFIAMVIVFVPFPDRATWDPGTQMAELHGFEIGPINKSNKPNKPIDKKKGGNVMKKRAVVKKGRQQ